jgi:5-methylcytosine-specific restriction endonuclease McrA
MTTPRTATTRWKKLRRQAIHRARTNGQTHCLLCPTQLDYHKHGQPNSAEADHIIADALGGEEHIDNIRIICRSCNGKLGGKVGAKKRQLNQKQKQKQNKPKQVTTTKLTTQAEW